MIPVSFGGCAGLLHPGRSGEGVVMCGAIGHETSATHRGLFELACQVAALGYEVLRFDYPGTGDSAASGAAARMEDLERSIEHAAAFLRASRGIGPITLIGLRFGGLLACRAARRIAGAERLVLLDPVISGRHHVRELRLLASAWDAANGQAGAAQPGLDVVGERYEPEFLAALASIDLVKTAPPPSRMLIVADERVGLAAFEQACREGGSDVARVPFPGLSSYLVEPVEAVVPWTAFTSVTSWLGAADTAPGRALQALPADLELGYATETPLFFGPQRELFGVLCRPSRDVRHGAPVLVFVNTGVTRHVGDAGLFVEAARALASHGVASFRLDLAGVGDSGVDPNRSGLVYNPSAQEDVSAALDCLAQSGYGRFAVLGICSGAHLALHAARADPRITAVIMVNLQKFVWSPERSLKIQRKQARRPARYYLAAMISRHGWARLLRGDLDLRAIAVAMMSKPWLHAQRLCASQAERWGVPTRFGRVRGWLQQLADRQVDVRFWFGRDDQGVAEFASWFGPGGRNLRGIDRLRTRLVDGTDHAMQSPRSRQTFISLLLEEVGGEFGRSLEPVESGRP